ncbi:hypothetical protein [Paraclostridium bifermentans]|uniref:hypothetical protein n=1 Tax=Paraclostridium bifermentans TaxID=1490 RepID=UPI00374E8A7E
MKSVVEYLKENYGDKDLVDVYSNLKEHLVEDCGTISKTNEIMKDIKSAMENKEIISNSPRYHLSRLLDDIALVLADKFCTIILAKSTTRKLNL